MLSQSRFWFIADRSCFIVRRPLRHACYRFSSGNVEVYAALARQRIQLGKKLSIVSADISCRKLVERKSGHILYAAVAFTAVFGLEHFSQFIPDYIFHHINKCHNNYPTFM